MKRTLSNSAMDRIIADLRQKEENRIARESRSAWRESTETDLASYEERNRSVYSEAVPVMPQVVEALQPGKPEDLKLTEVMQLLAAIAETHVEAERNRIVQCMRQIHSTPKLTKAATK